MITEAIQKALLDIAQRAGDAILEVYDQDFEVIDKADESPLTQADLASHAIIADGLAALTPDVPLISEESSLPAYEQRKDWQQYWLIDPLDGTKEFVNRNGEFTVNIALIEHGEPVFGVVGVPVQGLIYCGGSQVGWTRCLRDGELSPVQGRGMRGDQAELTVVASRSHGGERLEDYLEQISTRFPQLQRKPVGSSLKLCTLAAGDADLYPRLGPTSEWDIAAAHALLRSAGGEVYTFDGLPLRYNSKDSVLNPEFYAVADASFDWQNILPALSN